MANKQDFPTAMYSIQGLHPCLQSFVQNEINACVCINDCLVAYWEHGL